MTLSSAFNIINSAFDANAAQTAAISRNISNSSTAGYSLKTANLATNSYGGVEVSSITRATNAALFEQMLAANSTSAQQAAVANGLTQLSATVSDSTSTSASSSTTTATGQSPSALLASLADGAADLRDLAERPDGRAIRRHCRLESDLFAE